MPTIPAWAAYTAGAIALLILAVLLARQWLRQSARREVLRFRARLERPQGQGKVALSDNHFILQVPVSQPGELISVELWPTPLTETMGLLGCDLSAVLATGR